LGPTCAPEGSRSRCRRADSTLVVSALAVHHLDADGKRDLFRRVAGALRPGGRFVLADVVVPELDEDAVTPLSPEHDLPDRTDDQLRWLEGAGLRPHVAWVDKDLAVIVSEKPELGGELDYSAIDRWR
jgi:tRNA (cmo5U34)-methyltransferase